MAAGLLAFFIALLASLMLVVPVRALALRVGMVDLPGPRKVHLTPIPLLGGLAMYAAVVIACRSVEGEKHRDHHRCVHRQAAKKWDWREVNFARPRQIDHSNAQRW